MQHGHLEDSAATWANGFIQFVERVVAPSFGPNGKTVLFGTARVERGKESDLNRVDVCKRSVDIMKQFLGFDAHDNSWLLPVIVDAIQSNDNLNHDGCSLLLILSAELLKLSQSLIQDGHIFNRKELFDGLHGSIDIIKQAVASGQFDQHIKYFRTFDIDTQEFSTWVRCLVDTQFTEGTSRTNAKLQHIILEALKGDRNRTDLISIPGKPIDDSLYKNGICIHGDIMSGRETLKSVKKIVLFHNENIDTKPSVTNITSPHQLESWKLAAEDLVRQQTRSLVKSDINCIFSSKQLHPTLVQWLKKNNIVSFEKVSLRTLLKLSKLSGARIVSMEDNDLSQLLEQKSVIGIVEGISTFQPNPTKAPYYFVESSTCNFGTLIIRGITISESNYAKQALHYILECIYATPGAQLKLVPGNGIFESILAEYLISLAAHEKYNIILQMATALKSVARVLAINSGRNIQLSNTHSTPIFCDSLASKLFITEAAVRLTESLLKMQVSI